MLIPFVTFLLVPNVGPELIYTNTDVYTELVTGSYLMRIKHFKKTVSMILTSKKMIWKFKKMYCKIYLNVLISDIILFS